MQPSQPNPQSDRLVLLISSRGPLLDMLAHVFSVRGVETAVARSGAEVGRLISAGSYGAVIFDEGRSGCRAMDPHVYGYSGPLIVLADPSSGASDLHPGDDVIPMPTDLESLIERVLRVLPAA